VTTRPVIAVVGAGGIGHPAVVALAGAGAGADVDVRIIDDDRVERTNLHRLPFATRDDVGTAKTEVLRRVLAARGRTTDVMVASRVDPASALELLAGARVVIEGADNYPTKFLVADACGILGIPVVHGAAVGWIGTVLSVRPGASACYRCVFEDVPAGDTVDCATAGVYGPVTAVIGALMAADALRLVRGDATYAGAIASYDGWRNAFRSVSVARRADCALCGTRAIRALDPRRYAPPACDA
jgi:molybdopterin/thiamine biosynthesis adenylyltransferase